MKEIIQYYYKISNFIINNKDNNYTLLYKNELYIINKVIDIEMLNKVLIYKNDFPMYEIIYTIFNTIYFEYDNQKYILYKVRDATKLINDNFIFPILNINYKINTDKIWEHNINYLKNEINKLNYNNIEFIDNINYYIGMAENAIYLYGIGDSIEEYARITLSHYRISIPNVSLFYYNPNNLVIDYISRDIAEYIKSSFFYNTINVDQVINLINKYKLNNKEIYYLLARLMYPSYFFDKINELEKIKYIIKKRNEYQIFLKEIFLQIKTASIDIDIAWL